MSSYLAPVLPQENVYTDNWVHYSLKSLETVKAFISDRKLDVTAVFAVNNKQPPVVNDIIHHLLNLNNLIRSFHSVVSYQLAL